MAPAAGFGAAARPGLVLVLSITAANILLICLPANPKASMISHNTMARDPCVSVCGATRSKRKRSAVADQQSACGAGLCRGKQCSGSGQGRSRARAAG